MKINEIFYSIQGEGRLAGTAAVFVRFSGCNRRCSFCDTRHENGEELSEKEILERIAAVAPRDVGAVEIVLTGGEPLLQTTPSLINAAGSVGRFVGIETNGSLLNRFPFDVRVCVWITASPKTPEDVEETIRFSQRRRTESSFVSLNEIKIVYDGREDLAKFDRLPDYVSKYLQPLAVENDATETALNIRKTVDYVKENPQWKLSLQTQKILGIR